MPKQNDQNSKFTESGVTMIEIMVSSGLAGILFIVIFSLFSQGAKFANNFNGQASSIEGTSEAIQTLYNLIPQTSIVVGCGCRGAATLRASCVWDGSNPWYDPVLDAGQATGVTLFEGMAEHFWGTSALDSLAGLVESSSEISGGASSLVGCSVANWFPVANGKGCSSTVKLRYYSSVLEAGTVPSKPGYITFDFASGNRQVVIGKANANQGSGGSVIGGWGVTEASCGFDTTSSNSALTYVLNLKIKSKSNVIERVADSNYESWHRSGQKYASGQFKQVLLKFRFNNLGQRGIYSFRPQGVRNCKANGVASTSKEQCCSRALTGGVCATCIASGVAGTVNNCCSERVTTGVCD